MRNKVPERKNMIKALRQEVVPLLRRAGFSGSFPHFRRISKDKIDLIMFQFNKYGGSFVIEVAQCSPKGRIHSWGEKVPPEKVKVYDCLTEDRERITYDKDIDRDEWISYENADYEKAAKEVTHYIDKAESWFKNRKPVWKYKKI